MHPTRRLTLAGKLQSALRDIWDLDISKRHILPNNFGENIKPGRSNGRSNLPPHIEGHHRVLCFNIQRTEEYSIAMCYTMPSPPSQSCPSFPSWPSWPSCPSCPSCAMQKYLSWEKVVLIILYFQEMQLPMMWEGCSTKGFFEEQCKKITKKKL